MFLLKMLKLNMSIATRETLMKCNKFRRKREREEKTGERRNKDTFYLKRKKNRSEKKWKGPAHTRHKLLKW